jgi:ElaB/YqjD/DUF883 family membrane-anchored ribosome-binding protein
MDETKRDDAPKSPMTGSQGSGSDTLSAAKISAGTSVGNAGQPATPVYQSSASQGSSGSSQGRSTSDFGRSGSQGQSTQGMGETVTRSAQAAADTARQTASDLRERASDAVEEASDWAQDQYERGSRQFERVRDQSMQQFRQARGGIERFVNENPLMVGLIGVAAGLVIGALLPRTRQEDRAFGQWADQVRDQGWRYAREATQRGREYVEEAFGGDTEDERGEWRPDESRGGIRSSGPRYQNH